MTAPPSIGPWWPFSSRTLSIVCKGIKTSTKAEEYRKIQKVTDRWRCLAASYWQTAEPILATSKAQLSHVASSKSIGDIKAAAEVVKRHSVRVREMLEQESSRAALTPRNAADAEDDGARAKNTESAKNSRRIDGGFLADQACRIQMLGYY